MSTSTLSRTVAARGQAQVSRSTLARTMNGIIEGCWLLAIVTIPLFFNVSSRRVFEPDKITIFRNLVILMVIALIVKGIEAAPRLLARSGAATARGESSEGESREHDPRSALGTGGRPALGPLQSTLSGVWRTSPLIVPVAIFVVVYVAATITSIDPGISFWGSYERLQGTYTWLSYITFFLIMITHVHRWQQIERMISAAIFTSIPIALYGVLQHFHIEFLQWGGDVFTRVASTMGNAIFLGAYLLMVVPLTLYRLYVQMADLTTPLPAPPPPQAGRGGRRGAGVAPIPAWQRRREQRHGMIMLGVYVVALLLELFAILYTYSRGPFGGLVVALLTFGLIAGLRFRLRWLAVVSVGLLVLGLLVLGAANMKNPLLHAGSSGISRLIAVTSSESGTTEVRTLIWQGSKTLIKERPLLGWGPETMLLAYNPVYPPALGHIEAANASPDRNHDEEMDFLVMSGVLGLLAYLFILGTFFWMAFSLVRRLRGIRESILVIALIAIVLGHIGEGLTGIAIVSTLVMLWTCFALISVIYRMAPAAAAAAIPAGTAAQSEAAPPAPSNPRPARGQGPGAGRAATARGSGAPAQSRRSSTGWEHLTGGRMVTALGGAGVGVIAIVALLVLFFNNYQVVAADVTFKDALNYEQTANNYAAQGHSALQASTPTGAAQTNTTATSQQQAQQNYNAAFFYFNQAISLFHQAIDAQPSQDFYYLYLGKTLLEKVQADRDVNNLAARNNDILDAQTILLQAYHLNHLDTDHSANLGRMYTLWAAWDPTKWPLALQWFDKATHLSPHHSRLIDEYGLAVRSDGQYLAGLGAAKQSQARTLYVKARDIFKRAATVDPQLSDAFALWGDTEFVPVFLGNPSASIYPYEQALTLLPSDGGNVPAIDTNLGIAYLQEKKYAQAASYANKAITLAATMIKANPTSQQQLGPTYNQALAVFNQASAQLKKKR